MRRVSCGAIVFLALVACAMAQGPYSLQVAETAAPAKQGALRATAGLNLGSDTMYLGGRGAFSLLDGLMVFGDVGWVDVDGWDGGPSFQGGALFTLPLPAPVDIGIRGAIYKPFLDSSVSIWGGTLGGVVSRDLETVVPGLSVYGYLGLDFSTATWKARTPYGEIDVSDDEVNPALAIGAVFRCADKVSLYAEISYVDDPFIGGGVRVDF